jgi:hypothetical protein
MLVSLPLLALFLVGVFYSDQEHNLSFLSAGYAKFKAEVYATKFPTSIVRKAMTKRQESRPHAMLPLAGTSTQNKFNDDEYVSPLNSSTLKTLDTGNATYNVLPNQEYLNIVHPEANVADESTRDLIFAIYQPTRQESTRIKDKLHVPLSPLSHCPAFEHVPQSCLAEPDHEGFNDELSAGEYDAYNGESKVDHFSGDYNEDGESGEQGDYRSSWNL